VRSDVVFPLAILRTIGLALTVWVLAAAAAALPEPPPEGGVEILADVQESVGRKSSYRGNVEFRSGGIVVTADEADYDDETGELEARGNVHYRNLNGNEDLFAEKIAYDVREETGTFYETRGTVSAASQAGARILTTDNPFFIEGPLVTKARNTYRVHDGTVTNCDPQSKWWTVRAPKTTIRPGDSATIHRGVFRLKGVPLLYVPVFKKSLERVPRKSGFLTPSIGNSSRFGFVLAQAYYWAINRSYDATINGTLFTSRGIAAEASMRGRPTENSSFDAVFFGVEDRGPKLPNGERGDKQGGNSFTMKGVAALPGGFRGVADLRYLSSLEFRQAFTQTFEEAANSQVRSIGFITKNFSTYSINAALARDENFQTTRRGDTIVLRKLPSVEFNSRERRIAGNAVPLYLSFDSAFDLASRTQPQFQTRRFVQRGDLYPRLSSNIYWKGFNVTPTFGARLTGYGQRRAADGLSGQNLYRQSAEFGVDIAPPAIARIFNGPKWLGDKVKHVIEPRIRYRYNTGIDNFDSALLFDQRDVFHDTNEAEISLTQRLFSKSEASGRTREILSLELWQRRFFDHDLGGAIVSGRRNVVTSSLGLTPFAFFDQPRGYSPIAAALRTQPTDRWALEWRTDYDPLREKIVNSSVTADYRLSDTILVGVGHNAVRTPEELSPPSNQITNSLRYGGFNRRGWNFAVSSIYDYRQQLFVYAASQASYNTDCCGFGFEVRRFAIPTRSENQFRISLSIANVGSFGTLRPQERLF